MDVRQGGFYILDLLQFLFGAVSTQRRLLFKKIRQHMQYTYLHAKYFIEIFIVMFLCLKCCLLVYVILSLPREDVGGRDGRRTSFLYINMYSIIFLHFNFLPYTFPNFLYDSGKLISTREIYVHW